MIVDDIEDDFDPGAVQRLDHVAKLIERAEWVGSGAVAAMRGEKREGLISPIVSKTRRTVLLVKAKTGSSSTRR